MEDKRIELQDFLRRLNSEPELSELDRTADGKAKTLPISFVEMTLDELFLGVWGHRNFTTKLISNEVVGELELWVKHPITEDIITRSGAAGIIIQMDKAPENLTGQEKNNWALNPSNKKPNALDLGYPKLKAECIKNAAQSLGKIFGRDLNRKKNDKFNAAYKELSDAGFKSLLDRIESGDWKAVQLAETNFTLSDVQKSILEGHKPKQLTNGSI